MLRLTELKLPLDHPPEALRIAALARLGIPTDDLLNLSVARRGYDARRRSAINLVYAVDAEVRDTKPPSWLATLPSDPPPTPPTASPSTSPCQPVAPSSSAPAPAA